ncbi:MAG: ATP-binding protein, partial [Chloroflexi bacterium]|nr:ATP-binding protein [Chloroflexota bacterium]
MFDSGSSQDNSVTVLLSDGHIADAPSQSLVRIRSKDGRRYLGTVVAGPFAEPDGLRADSNVLVTVVTRGGIFVPPYHGRVQVEILGEEHDGGLVPPRYRPLPNSPVVVLNDAETAEVLRSDGDIQIGQVIGHEAVTVAIPSTRKDVLPRHTAILGTTGGGKSTTVARLVQQAQAAGCAVIVLDVEGEYTFLHEPTVDPTMQAALERRGLAAAGLTRMWLCHLVGRETANPEHPARAEFCLRFDRPSPYTLMELLELTDAQQLRFLKAYDVAKALLRELGIFPERGRAEHDQLALDVDDFDRGYPYLELAFLLDVVGAFGLVADKDVDALRPRHPAIRTNPDPLIRRAQAAKPDNAISWRALLGKLGSLNRLKVFDRGRDARPLNFAKLLQPGAVTVVDLSDTGSPVVNNLVIADLLRGVQEAQDEAYAAFEMAKRQGHEAAPPTRALIVIEEAHEFLSAGRVDKMPVLFEQVARIARRGRKRWLGRVFVSQLPQHLPRELFGLVNSYVLHKITDPQVVTTLRATVSGIDESLWKRLPGLAPGQALVAFPH